jgi:ribonuclease III
MNHEFTDTSLLEEALTHTSWAYEQGGEHNERLEFLGDAVLQLTCTEILYRRFPDDREGVLHKYRTQLVSTGHLAKIARSWDLGTKVRLGKGEDATGGREKERLLAGLFEAVLGAIYLDGGFAAAQSEVCAALDADLAILPTVADARVTVHEWCQRTHGTPPNYAIVDTEGPPHDRTFTVEVSHPGGPIARGQGRSKRTATIAAAEAAMTAGLPD